MPPEAGSILLSYVDRSITAAQPQRCAARPSCPTTRLRSDSSPLGAAADAFHLHRAVACRRVDRGIESLRNPESDPAVASGDSPVALHGTAVSSIDTHRTVARSHRQFLQSAANLDRTVTGVSIHAASDGVDLEWIRRRCGPAPVRRRSTRRCGHRRSSCRSCPGNRGLRSARRRCERQLQPPWRGHGEVHGL